MNIIAFTSHDWRHCLQYGAAVRHAVFLDRLIRDEAVGRLLWVRRVRPGRAAPAWKRPAAFKRLPLFPAPGGLLYRIVRYNGRDARGACLLEHHLPHFLNHYLAAYIRRIAAPIARVRDAGLFVGDPKEAWAIGNCGERRSLFDAMDDWRRAPEFRHQTDRIRNGYKLAARASVITANTEEAAARFEGCTRVRVIPNAADPRMEPAPPIPPGIKNLPRPLIGLIGHYTDERLDLGLVEGSLDAAARGTLIAAGSLARAPKARRYLAACPRAVMLGVLPHERVLPVLASLDALILPHAVSDYSLSQDSIKVYEAMMYGVPVVATPIHPAVDLRELCYVAETGEEWPSALSAALGEDADRRSKRCAAMADHTWDRRYSAFREALFG